MEKRRQESADYCFVRHTYSETWHRWRDMRTGTGTGMRTICSSTLFQPWQGAPGQGGSKVLFTYANINSGNWKNYRIS